MKINYIRNLAKQAVIGGMFLALNGCYTHEFRKTDCYQNSEITSQKTNISKKDTALIVLSPHLDDAVLSSGGILSEFEGQKYIVTFFQTPENVAETLTYWDKISGFKKSIESRKVREDENVNAANITGARIINKDYVDNQYEKRTDDSSFSIEKSIAKDIEKLISSINGGNVTVLGPSYFGERLTHPDHLIVSKAFIRTIKNNCYPNAQFYFYEDLPYTYKRFEKEDITLDKLLTDYYGLHVDKRDIFISKDAFDLKIEGIKAYSSQIKAFENIGNDIIRGVIEFGLSRCPQFPLPQKPCEVIYEMK